MDLTEQLDYSSAVALLGYTLIAAILRAFNVRSETGRVMISAPFIAFVTTHILYLNVFKLDYGKVEHLEQGTRGLTADFAVDMAPTSVKKTVLSSRTMKVYFFNV
ncbi:Per1-like [Dillenia turbinata]|uniref:Post-GPI attachment to proteins factor 3 n=1 Tax=Dillenia turbinata TaxID=194707 RepID=A0AAN8V7C1_9MAGN